jgi:hypothetical protein
MSGRWIGRVALIAAASLLALAAAGCGESSWDGIRVLPGLEDRTPEGDLYTPTTQSLLRGYHWLESIEELEIRAGDIACGEVRVTSSDPDYFLRICNMPLEQLVPRLHYAAASPPDAFDAFNLMLAEYSRNSLSAPVGEPGDETTHFETNLVEAVPWTLRGDYSFEPYPAVRPVRVSLINNCLAPGLWELSATDPSGEVYHAWFEMPPDLYDRLVARANGVDEAFARRATAWSPEPVPLRLARLRTIEEKVGTGPLALSGYTESGYSTQDSRRKLDKGYVLVERDGRLQKPERLGELTSGTCYLSTFVEPGKYSYSDRSEFDLGFLRETVSAEVRRVRPLTRYNWFAEGRKETGENDAYLELVLRLRDYSLVLGNLPLELLVPQEDFAINGFGVGVLSSSGIAERRKYLIDEGPCPSFAYLCREEGEKLVGLNSHEFGIEQVFVRTHLHGGPPWWEITITSYERMVDLVKYRVDIPAPLREEVESNALEYIAPLYLTYRDDNLR